MLNVRERTLRSQWGKDQQTYATAKYIHKFYTVKDLKALFAQMILFDKLRIFDIIIYKLSKMLISTAHVPISLYRCLNALLIFKTPVLWGIMMMQFFPLCLLTL